MKGAIRCVLACFLSCVTIACVEEYESTLGSACETTNDCREGLQCTRIVSGPICAMKCDSEMACADLGGQCGWEPIEYPGGATVDSYLCLPRLER